MGGRKRIRRGRVSWRGRAPRATVWRASSSGVELPCASPGLPQRRTTWEEGKGSPAAAACGRGLSERLYPFH